MLPRLGTQFPDHEIELIVKPRHEYQTTAYAELGLPKAPAIMIGPITIAAGHDIDEQTLINAIKRYSG